MRGTIPAPAGALADRDAPGPTASTTTQAEHDAPEPSDALLLFRLGIGLAELGGGAVISALRVLDGLRAAPAPAGMPEGAARPANDVPVAARHVLLGAIVATPRALAEALAHAARASAPARQLAGRGGRLLGRLPGAGVVLDRWDGLQARAAVQLAEWGALGRREEIKGRSLARLAVTGFFEVAIAQVAESPDLKRVIEEQSQGVTVAAVTELRERSQRADNAVEAFARRLVGLRRRGSK